MATRTALVPTLLVVLSTACSDASRPTALEAPPPSLLISDAVHGGGNAHFFWLAPMVRRPSSFNGSFDGSLSPTVVICDLADCGGQVIATFGMATGSGSERVRVSAADEQYIVNWHTDEFNVGPGPTYRISVRVAGTELGFADVQITSNGMEAKNLTTATTIGLKDGRTLPITFRIEEGAVYVVSAATGGTVLALGGAVTLAIPPGAMETETGITVQVVQPTGSTLAVVEFGPSGLQFAQPVPITIAYNPAALPPGISESDLALNIKDPLGRWIVVPGSTVDAVTKTVTAPFHHFSEGGVGPAELALFCSGDGDPDTFETIEASLEAVMDPGTVEVCSGSHAAERVLVTRPVTIQPMQGATPTFTTDAEAYAFVVGGYTAGSVVFDGLTFEMTTPTVDAPPIFGNQSFTIWAGPPGGADPYDQVLIRNSTFNTAQAVRGSIRVNPSVVAGGRVVVENVTITGGDIGIQVVAGTLEASQLTAEGLPGSRWALLVGSSVATQATVQSSTLRNWEASCIQVSNNASATIQESNLDHCWASVATGASASLGLISNVITMPDLTGVPADDPNTNVLITNGATAQVEDNDLLGCGELQCMNITGTGTSATLVRNRIVLPAEGSAAAASTHSVVQITSGASATVLENSITGCWGRCISTGASASATIADNTITIPASFPPAGTAIASFPGPDLANRASVTITNNNIEALGQIGDIHDYTSYPLGTGIRIDNTTASEVSGNSIRRAAWGIQSMNGSDVQNGRDNTIDQTLWPIRTSGYSPSEPNPTESDGRMTLRFSDITSYVQSLWVNPGDMSTVLTCNYWGPAGAPEHPLNPDTDPVIYTPWATAPIAGTGATSCE